MGWLVLLRTACGDLCYCVLLGVICVTAYCMGLFVLLRIAWGYLCYCILHGVISVTAYCMGSLVLLRIAWGDLCYCVLHGVICVTAYCMGWLVLLRIAWGYLCYCVLHGVICVTAYCMGSLVLLRIAFCDTRKISTNLTLFFPCQVINTNVNIQTYPINNLPNTQKCYNKLPLCSDGPLLADFVHVGTLRDFGCCLFSAALSSVSRICKRQILIERHIAKCVTNL